MWDFLVSEVEAYKCLKQRGYTATLLGKGAAEGSSTAQAMRTWISFTFSMCLHTCDRFQFWQPLEGVEAIVPTL